MITLEIGKKYREHFSTDDFGLITLAMELNIPQEQAFQPKEFVVLETDRMIAGRPAVLVQYEDEDTTSFILKESPAYQNASAIN